MARVVAGVAAAGEGSPAPAQAHVPGALRAAVVRERSRQSKKRERNEQGKEETRSEISEKRKNHEHKEQEKKEMWVKHENNQDRIRIFVRHPFIRQCKLSRIDPWE